MTTVLVVLGIMALLVMLAPYVLAGLYMILLCAGALFSRWFK